jgi:hypothetical protein
MSPDAERLYGKFYREFIARATRRELNGSPPDVVAEAVLSALRDGHPHRRYVVGKDARMLATLPKVLPAALLDRVRMKIFGMPTRFGEVEQN